MRKTLFLIVTAVFSLLACEKEEGVESLNFEDSAFSIVGRWYVERAEGSNPLLDMFGEYTFTVGQDVYADEYRRINGYKRDSLEGTYSINDNLLTTNMKSSYLMSNMNNSEIDIQSPLTFTTRLNDASMTFQRIVGMIPLKVGDTISVDARLSIETYTLDPIEVSSYTITDDAIAFIDEKGLLTAKMIGVTYLLAETSLGTAVMKVSVSDNKNLWTDFSQFLGKDFDEVERMLGKHYAFKSDSMRYFFDNPYVENVDIYRHNNIADSIVLTFKDNLPDDVVRNFLMRTLVPVDTLKGWYTNNTNYLLTTYSATFHSEEKKLVYSSFEPDWDDRIDDFGLTLEELEKKYGRTSTNYETHTPLGTQVGFKKKIIKNDFVEKIYYYLNPHVHMYSILVKNIISIQAIDDYLNKRFIYSYWGGNEQSPKWQYIKNVQVGGREIIVRVTKDGSHTLDYRFEENK